MRILIHSNGPMVPSGYGVETKLLMQGLAKLGHEVACSAFSGLSGSAISWGEFTIFPAGLIPFSPDVLAQHAMTFGADLVITLMDFWKLKSAVPVLASAPFKMAAWLPIDSTPVSRLDAEVLSGIPGCFPIAMSEFGQRQLHDAGFDSTYIPHMVSTGVFKPLAHRGDFRREIGVGGKFVIGICSANQDAVRKGWPEQFRAFAKFHARHPDSVLMVHTIVNHPKGFDLGQMAADMGIIEHTLFTDQYAQIAGQLAEPMMADWYSCLDVLSHCGYAEAFGIPSAEAQAAGTPVIATDGSAMREVAGPTGRLVKGTEFWNYVHRAWWVRPDVDAIARAYEDAYLEYLQPTTAARRRRAARRHAVASYDTELVMEKFWRPFLEGVEITDNRPLIDEEGPDGE